jgi:hypothetical protein
MVFASDVVSGRGLETLGPTSTMILIVDDANVGVEGCIACASAEGGGLGVVVSGGGAGSAG